MSQAVGKNQVGGDRDVFLEAVKHDPDALRWGSEELRGDRELVLAAVRAFGASLERASEELRGDKEVVLAAVANNGMAVRFSSEELKADREVMLEAMSENPYSFIHAKQDLREDRDFLLLAARRLSDRDWKYLVRFFADMIQATKIPDQVIRSAVAVSGEDALVTTITLSNSLVCSELTVNNGFQAEVCLMSGVNFTCSVEAGETTDRAETTRPGPTVADLAAKLVGEIPKQCQVANLNRVFVNFIINDDGDAVAVSPWECEQPLADFLFQVPLPD